MTNRISGIRAAAGLVAALATLAVAQPAAAQGTFDPRWQGWLGCWEPSDALPPGATPPVVCVSPIAGGSAVELAFIQDSAVTARDTIDASGVEKVIDKQGCTGTQSGQWSADNRRVFVHSALHCAGGLSQTGNTIVGMTPGGDWINVQSLSVANGTGVRTIHYRDANSLKTLPAAFAGATADRALAIAAARTAAGAPLDIPAVLEAVRRADTTTVQAWIIARGTRFNFSAKQLVAMADAGVPPSVTDVMIGVSYPEHFALREPAGGGGTGFAPANAGAYAESRAMDCANGISSFYGGGLCDPCQSAWAYDPFAQFGYGDCGFGSRYGLGYGYGLSLYNRYRYGAGYSYGPFYGAGYGYNAAPVIVVRGEESETPHGRVVNGRGYTQSPGSSAGGTGSSRSAGSSGGGASTSAGSTSAGSSSAGSSSAGSSSSGGRTAHPRPPV